MVWCMQVRDARSLSSVALLDLRKRAVVAVTAGRSIVSVAATLGISRQAVSRWVRSAELKGETILIPKRKGRPKGRMLRSSQAKFIIRRVVEHLPDELNLPFYLWTRDAVNMLVRKKYGVKLSVWTVGRMLKEWGLSPQKPSRRAYERDPEKVRLWLEKEYPAIRERARRERALILWEDEMGIRSDSQVGRTYALIGKTPVVPVTGRRFSCNMLAGITNKGKLHFMVFLKSFTGKIFLIFLKRLVKQVDKKIFLIADSHPAHKAKDVKKYLATHKRKIVLFFLSPYSPDLNPSEFLNNDAKTNTIRKTRPRTQAQMTSGLRKYLRSKQRTPHKVKKFFHAESVRYAAH